MPKAALRRRRAPAVLPIVGAAAAASLAALIAAAAAAVAHAAGLGFAASSSGPAPRRPAVRGAAVGAAAAAARQRVIVTDVDGTLMDSSHKLPPANRQALRRCMESGVPVVLATGKHRGPWVASLISQVIGDEGQASEGSGLRAASDWTLNAPGVFVQGLLVCDAGGQVVQRTVLEPDVAQLCRSVAQRRGWTVLSYTEGDRVISNRADPETERLRPLQEPLVEVGDVGDVAVHKMLFLCSPAEEDAVRLELAGEIADRASLTVAIAGMVEVLPFGASKADGVRTALDLLGLSPSEALALGDGENDLELLTLVREAGGVAAAVGNARQRLKDVAGAVVGTCDEGGWAEAVERWVLVPPTGG